MSTEDCVDVPTSAGFGKIGPGDWTIPVTFLSGCTVTKLSETETQVEVAINVDGGNIVYVFVSKDDYKDHVTS